MQFLTISWDILDADQANTRSSKIRIAKIRSDGPRFLYRVLVNISVHDSLGEYTRPDLVVERSAVGISQICSNLSGATS